MVQVSGRRGNKVIRWEDVLRIIVKIIHSVWQKQTFPFFFSASFLSLAVRFIINIFSLYFRVRPNSTVLYAVDTEIFKHRYSSSGYFKRPGNQLSHAKFLEDLIVSYTLSPKHNTDRNVVFNLIADTRKLNVFDYFMCSNVRTRNIQRFTRFS